jgi:hypothetical protein
VLAEALVDVCQKKEALPTTYDPVNQPTAYNFSIGTHYALQLPIQLPLLLRIPSEQPLTINDISASFF